MSNVDVYVSVMHKYYNFSPHNAPWEFHINVDPGMLKVFDQLFAQMKSWDDNSIVRAQIPAVPYHFDQQNDEVDKRLKKVYALIHEYGDKDTKKFIEQMPYYS
ncbi:MAG TPA: transposase [Rummeliibacillus sp.]|nr:transposase [Rummeliibacillus sp.]